MYVSNNSSILLHKYIADVRRFPLLKKEEEDKLITLKCLGNLTAREKLINCNLRIVLDYVLNKFSPYRVEIGKKQIFSIMDLIQEGNKGLIEAVDKVEFREDSRFMTFSLIKIKKAVYRGLIKNFQTIRITEQKNIFLRKVRKIEESLTQKLERNPEIFEIANEIKKDYKIVHHIISISKNIVYINDIYEKNFEFDSIKKWLDLERESEAIPESILLDYVFQLSYLLHENQKKIIQNFLNGNGFNFEEGSLSNKQVYAFYGSAVKHLKKLIDPTELKKMEI